jgi:hypothetical protein
MPRVLDNLQKCIATLGAVLQKTDDWVAQTF